MTWTEAFDELGVTIAHRRELLAVGATGRSLTAAVRGGHLLRVRRDHYALPGVREDLLRAVRVGGRLACVSALAYYGVFALDLRVPHIHLARPASRLRSPDNRRHRLPPRRRRRARLHWSPLADAVDGDEYVVGLKDALAQAICCQHPWHAVASLDNALHLGLIEEGDLAELFGAVPAGKQHLRGLVDGRCEAGQESILRLAMREVGLRCEPQVTIPGVGRVDFVVEDCVVVEADSRLAHEGWAAHVRDRNRDLALARIGYPSLRPVFEQTVFHTTDVVAAIVALVRVTRR